MALTYLYAPADRPDRVRKALDSDADVVIVDLEDAVALSAKDAARAEVPALVGDGTRAVQVRINAAGSPWHAADLEMVRGLPQAVGVRIPKAEAPASIDAIANAAGHRDLHLLIESALGLERAYDLATSHPWVASIGLGEADLKADLGVTSDDGLLWARSRIVVAAAAARLQPPTMSVFTDVKDLDGLAASCDQGKALGFLGRAAIHPAQLPVIRAAFTPTAAEIARAREIVAVADQATSTGTGAIALPDGRFVDEAVVRQARRTLSFVERSQPGETLLDSLAMSEDIPLDPVISPDVGRIEGFRGLE